MMSMNEDSILSEMSDELKELCTHPDPEQPIINEELKQQVIELEKKWICFYDESCRKASSEVVRNVSVLNLASLITNIFFLDWIWIFHLV